MRIVGGSLRGLALKTPKGLATRPMTSRVREALFTVLGDLDGVRMLDLFAGSGAIGIEALSRGASEVVFVEKGRRQAAVIRNNLAAAKVSADIMTTDVYIALDRLERDERTFHFIFADPPYESGHAQRILDVLFNGTVAAKHAVVGVTVRDFEPLVAPPAGWKKAFDRCYGDTRLAIYSMTGEEN